MVSFEFVRKWFLKAATEAKRQGRKDSVQLWKDGLAHLDALKARNEKLEDFVRVVRQAADNESGLDGFEKRVLEALAGLDKEAKP